MLNKYLLKLVKKLFSSIDIINLTKKEQIEFLTTLDTENLDNFKRSYNQYLCQKYFSKSSYLLLTVISFFTLFPSIILLLLKRIFIKKSEVKYDNVLRVVSNEIIPDSLKNGSMINSKNDTSLGIKDLKIIFKLIIKYPLSFYFIQKNIIKLAIISNDIYMYSNKKFIVNDEYSFSSSFVTEYCERNGILNINIMHGDKLFYIRDAFCSFHKFYVWDKHYIELFLDLHADEGQFILEKPSLFDYNDILKNSNTFKYYLDGFESEEQVITLLESLKNIQDKYTIILRKHPRYEFSKKIENLLIGFTIENKDINIKKSIIESEYICAQYSTVLLEGYFAGKTIIINDLFININKLEELDYIITKKDFLKLSDFIK